MADLANRGLKTRKCVRERMRTSLKGAGRGRFPKSKMAATKCNQMATDGHMAKHTSTLNAICRSNIQVDIRKHL